ncbi:MAG: sigma-70 family RNA polymerase sigma factor [Pseudomonadota bacterium]
MSMLIPCNTNSDHAMMFRMATSDASALAGGLECDPLAIMKFFSDRSRRILHVPVLLSPSYLAKVLLRIGTRVWMSDEDDLLQLQKVANGDRQAIGVLYQRHNKRVFHFVRRFVTDPQLAEDVTNDVFIEVWQKADTFAGRSKVSSWVLGMARYKALSEVRKRKPVHSKSDEILESLQDDADDPEMVSQKLDKGAAIKRCMAMLSRDHRVILELIYYHEKSMEEVADILDIPKNTVKTRTFHARKQLSEKMTAQGLDRGWP